MRLASLAGPLMGLALIPMLGGCSLEATMTTCANCGEVKSVTARPVHRDIRLHTDAPGAWTVSAAEANTRAVVYHVRVRMDRGGSRDFLVPRDPGLHPGDRVEIRDGALMVRAAAGYRWS
jgi:hypothetical protein